LAMKKLGIVLCLAISIAGCGTGKTMVMQAGETKRTFTYVDIKEGNSTVSVPAKVKIAFLNKLNTRLYSENLFRQGKELVIQYRFVQFNEGHRFKRWLTAGIGNSGEGSLSVEAIFLDKDGKEISKIMTEGKIGSGFLGGSMDDAVETAAEEIGNYTISQYK